MHLSTLSSWLDYLGSIHRRDIELGLDRVKTVANRLHLLRAIPQQQSNKSNKSNKPICILVGGTNGKGSTVASLSAIYRAAGFHVGTFTSPYLFQHNEEVQIDNKMASDADFCRAFSMIETARKEISLTPFEFHTLAALILFRDSDTTSTPLDVIILEIGLGGRLDAVNIVDADLAIITSIDIDHVDWLGHTRDAIGREKAGIFRAHKPAICGDFSTPKTILQYADALPVQLYCQGRDFEFMRQNDISWSWRHNALHYNQLPTNDLAIENMSTVLMAITVLQNQLPVSQSAIQSGLNHLTLPGRIQKQQRSDGGLTIFDVAHNPAACRHLANHLKNLKNNRKNKGRWLAVFSMLADKEISASIQPLSSLMDEWFIADLKTPRAANCATLIHALNENGIDDAIQIHDTILDAYQAAIAKSEDVIVVFGSFYVIAGLARMGC